MIGNLLEQCPGGAGDALGGLVVRPLLAEVIDQAHHCVTQVNTRLNLAGYDPVRDSGPLGGPDDAAYDLAVE